MFFLKISPYKCPSKCPKGAKQHTAKPTKKSSNREFLYEKTADKKFILQKNFFLEPRLLLKKLPQNSFFFEIL